MIVFGFIVTIAILFIILPIVDWDNLWYFLLLDLIVIGLGLGVNGVIRSGNNPESKNYFELKTKYDFITKQDSVPFEIRQELYGDCSRFNNNLFDNKFYHSNVWIGFYYPEVSDTTMVSFDLSKIK